VTPADIWALALAAVLVGISAILGASETALAHVSRLRVEELVRDRRRGATRLAKVVADAAQHLNVLLLARTVAEMLATTLVAVVCERQLPAAWEAVLIAGVGMAAVHYVVVGVGARTLGRQYADRVGLASAGTVLWLTRVLGPLPRVLIGVGSALIPGHVARDAGFT
jgi:CBS domain containing-hemolysin-like protein